MERSFPRIVGPVAGVVCSDVTRPLVLTSRSNRLPMYSYRILPPAQAEATRALRISLHRALMVGSWPGRGRHVAYGEESRLSKRTGSLARSIVISTTCPD